MDEPIMTKKLKLMNILNEVIAETKQASYTAYHGSPTVITKFSDDFIDEPDANAQEGSGIYFTTSVANAAAFGGNIHHVKMSGNFLDRTDSNSINRIKRDDVIQMIKMSQDWEGTAQNWSEDPETGAEMAADGMIDSSEDEGEVFQYIEGDFYRGDAKNFVRNMTKLGYDGLINWAPRDYHGDHHIIVYNPSIIEYIGQVDYKGNE